jgi:hypothetical protein
LLVVFVEAIATDCLATAARAGLKVATNLVNLAARHSTIVALRMIQIIGAVAIRNSVELLTINDESHRIHSRLLVAVPSRLFRVPSHAMS